MFISLHEGGVTRKADRDGYYESFNDVKLLILPVKSILYIVGRNLERSNDPYSIVEITNGHSFYVIEDAVTIARRMQRVLIENRPDLETP
jgi:hypothetical protein